MATKDTHSEILTSGAGLGAVVAAETGGELGEVEAIRARGYWEQVWLRFRRDRVAIGSGVFILFLFFCAFAGAAISSSLLGHGPNDQYVGNGTNPTTFLPYGPFHWIVDAYGGTVSVGAHLPHTLLILGSDGFLGRDEFLRLLYGARTSLEVALGATIIGMTIGVLMGAIAGYYGGWIDTVVSRLTEMVMCFPYLLFLIALASTVGDRLNNVTLGFLQTGVLALVLVLGLFSWFYPARIVRAQILSLREKEFIEAARMVGATDWRIIRSHLLPHLVAPIIVYSTLVIAQNILAEAGLSFLGVGIKQPTASWGEMLSDNAQYYTSQPWLMLWPGLAVLLTTLSFNLLGDGLRDAFDPRATVSSR